VLAGLAAVLAAGCGSSRASHEFERDQMVLDLADALREEALKVPQDGTRERLVSGLIRLRELMRTESSLRPVQEAPGAPTLPKPEGGDQPAPPWATMFAPRSLVVGFFTRSRNFDDVPGDDGLEVRLQPLDQFGDPAKAVGSYRIEIFEYRMLTGEKRGRRLGHWYVTVLDEESNRKYYDPVDRSYVFPLLWNQEIEPGSAAIVQATYYPPGGFTHKLFAQRVIKTGEPSE
jgi:hypothetical protein